LRELAVGVAVRRGILSAQGFKYAIWIAPRGSIPGISDGKSAIPSLPQWMHGQLWYCGGSRQQQRDACDEINPVQRRILAAIMRAK
jgi:hypothetical protein